MIIWFGERPLKLLFPMISTKFEKCSEIKDTEDDDLHS
jgi:hypothetical protein